MVYRVEARQKLFKGYGARSDQDFVRYTKREKENNEYEENIYPIDIMK